MDKIEAVFANEVKKEKAKYLWRPYMLDENVNIVGGEAGTGKTWFLCALMAAVTTSQPEEMPGRLEKSGSVIYAGGEDGNSVMRERLERVGADLSKIILIEKRFDVLGDSFREMVRDVKPALVIFDPLLSFVSEKVEANRYTVAKSLMDGLRELARETRTSIVCIIHPPKKDEYRLIHRFTGSGGFVDAARAATYVGYHPEAFNKRVIIQPKNNAGYTAPVVFELDADLGFIWVGEDEGITMRDVETSHRDSGQKKQSVDGYVNFITALLEANPDGIQMTAKEMIDAYGESDISVRSLGRALSSSALSERLLDDGIALKRGAKSNNRQRYIIKYE